MKPRPRDHDGAPETPEARGWWSAPARHPVITAVFVSCTVAGAVLGFYLLTDDWSAVRRIAAGAVAGAGTSVFVTVTRLFE